MSPRLHEDEGVTYWICRHCERCICCGHDHHCQRAPVEHREDRTVIAVAVGAFCVLLVAGWAFLRLIGWLP